VATVSTSDTDKAIVQDATIKSAIYSLSHIGQEEATLFGKPFNTDLLVDLKSPSTH
jgi:hypothetical protein